MGEQVYRWFNISPSEFYILCETLEDADLLIDIFETYPGRFEIVGPDLIGTDVGDLYRVYVRARDPRDQTGLAMQSLVRDPNRELN